jgi:hypothetical protein
MTPEQAEDIYHEACKREFNKHMHDYTPVNQRKGILAGFQAVIDEVTKEIDNDYANRTLLMAKFDSFG